MRIVHTDENVNVLSHDGVTYELEDGAFDVPEHVGQALLRFPHWQHEFEALAARAAAAKVAERDPGVTALRIRDLEQQLAALTARPGDEQLLARLAELEAENAALKADAPETEPEQPETRNSDDPDADPEATEQPKTKPARAPRGGAKSTAAKTDE